jgi:hypothetical protein
MQEEMVMQILQNLARSLTRSIKFEKFIILRKFGKQCIVLFLSKIIYVCEAVKVTWILLYALSIPSPAHTKRLFTSS